MLRVPKVTRHHLISGLIFMVGFGATIWLLWGVLTSSKSEQFDMSAMPNIDELVEAGMPQSARKPEGKLLGTTMIHYAPGDDFADITDVDVRPGSGEVVDEHDIVHVDYIAASGDTAVIYQTSLDSGQPAVLALDDLIPGWRDGMIGMQEGGTRRMYITADQAYGANPPPGLGLPANANVVIEVTLRKIEKH